MVPSVLFIRRHNIYFSRKNLKKAKKILKFYSGAFFSL
jgi:hypothetical protein